LTATRISRSIKSSPSARNKGIQPIGGKDLIIVHVGDDGVSFATRQIEIIQKIALCFIASAAIMHSLYSIFLVAKMGGGTWILHAREVLGLRPLSLQLH